MFSLEFEAAEAESEMLVAELWEAGCSGIVEEPAAGGRVTLRAFFEDNQEALSQQFAHLRPRLREHLPRDWVASARALFQPLTVGDRFYLAPEWRDDPTPDGRVRITVNPGLACGTGAHEATRLCLGALEKLLRPGMTVLDIGTGSGILSVAAALLGASRVIACDEDPVAVEIAAANFGRAGVKVELFAGSTGALRGVTADLAVANISASASAELAPDMLRMAGLAIASGFEAHEEDFVRRAVVAAGGIIQEVLAENAWRAILYTAARL
jgi:ribosomal protein L11 methyltransferase